MDVFVQLPIFEKLSEIYIAASQKALESYSSNVEYYILVFKAQDRRHL